MMKVCIISSQENNYFAKSLMRWNDSVVLLTENMWGSNEKQKALHSIQTADVVIPIVDEKFSDDADLKKELAAAIEERKRNPNITMLPIVFKGAEGLQEIAGLTYVVYDPQDMDSLDHLKATLEAELDVAEKRKEGKRHKKDREPASPMILLAIVAGVLMVLMFAFLMKGLPQPMGQSHGKELLLALGIFVFICLAIGTFIAMYLSITKKRTEEVNHNIEEYSKRLQNAIAPASTHTTEPREAAIEPDEYEMEIEPQEMEPNEVKREPQEMEPHEVKRETRGMGLETRGMIRPQVMLSVDHEKLLEEIEKERSAEKPKGKSKKKPKGKPTENSAEKLMERLAENPEEAQEANVLGLMVMNLENIKEFYTWSQIQAKASFALAVVLCIVGFFLIIVAIILLIISKANLELSFISGISGIITNAIAATALIVYRHSLFQLNYYHKALHEDERFLSNVNLLNRFSTKEAHDEMLKEIIRSEIQMNLREEYENVDINTGIKTGTEAETRTKAKK